jgi:hypothetical protein
MLLEEQWNVCFSNIVFVVKNVSKRSITKPALLKLMQSQQYLA